MIVIACEQGSHAWHQARLGIPTASQFHRILTPGTAKASAQATKYMHELLAAYFTGEPSGADASLFMERGTMMEDEARRWYAFDRGVELKRVGLCMSEDRMVAASPDALVGEDGILEIKCPSASVHVSYLLDGLEGEYRSQAQGLLMVTGRAWVDLLAYNPVLPKVVLRIERDEEYIEKLGAAVDTFVHHLMDARTRLEAAGCKPAAVKLTAGTLVDSQPF